MEGKGVKVVAWIEREISLTSFAFRISRAVGWIAELVYVFSLHIPYLSNWKALLQLACFSFPWRKQEGRPP